MTRGKETRPAAILTYVYVLVGLTIVVCTTTVGSLVHRQRAVHQSENLANNYHLASRLTISHMEFELDDLSSIIEGRMRKSAAIVIRDRDFREMQRSTFIIGRHLQAVTAAQRQFGNPDFETPIQRVTSALKKIDQHLAATHEPLIAKTVLADLVHAQIRCKQLRYLHTVAFREQTDIAQSQKSSTGLTLILLGTGGLSILLLLRLATRELRTRQRAEQSLEQRAIQAEALHQAITTANESLHQRDQAFRTAITPIVFCDLEGRITEANQAFADLFGFENVDQLIGKPTTEFPASPISVAQIHAGIMERGGFDGEITGKTIDGTPIEIQISATLVADADGRPTGSMSTFMDVTPRRNVERALRDSEQHYRTLVEAAPEAIVVLDVDAQRFVDANESALKLFRLQRQHLLEIGPMDLSPEFQPDGSDSAETSMAFVQRALEGEMPTFDWVHIDSEGNDIHCEIRLTRLSSRRRLVRGSVSDIGERIKLANALSQRATEAELLYQAVVMADETDSLDAALQKCVDIVCEMTAWPVGHVYLPSVNGAPRLEPTQIWHFNDEQRFAKFREVTERTSFAMGEGLPGRIWKSGEPAWIVNVQKDSNFPRNKLCVDLGVKGAFGFPVKLREEVVAILEFFIEEEAEKNETLLLLVRSVGEQVGRVIDRKEAEEASQTRHELVAEELEHAKDELILKTRLAAIGQMSAQIAHEMRNPLGAVSNAIY